MGKVYPILDSCRILLESLSLTVESTPFDLSSLELQPYIWLVGFQIVGRYNRLEIDETVYDDSDCPPRTHPIGKIKMMEGKDRHVIMVPEWTIEGITDVKFGHRNIRQSMIPDDTVNLEVINVEGIRPFRRWIGDLDPIPYWYQDYDWYCGPPQPQNPWPKERVEGKSIAAMGCYVALLLQQDTTDDRALEVARFLVRELNSGLNTMMSEYSGGYSMWVNHPPGYPPGTPPGFSDPPRLYLRDDVTALRVEVNTKVEEELAGPIDLPGPTHDEVIGMKGWYFDSEDLIYDSDVVVEETSQKVIYTKPFEHEWTKSFTYPFGVTPIDIDFTWKLKGKAIAERIKLDDCVIATAAFGSELDPHLPVLRGWRDRNQRSSPLIRGLVRLYYRISPPFARIVARSHHLRWIIRGCLRPIVDFIRRRNHSTL
ncbi:MAG: CFI-box-CTERM domain-containing protein [Candidatus Thorarchaeota archaeon]